MAEPEGDERKSKINKEIVINIMKRVGLATNSNSLAMKKRKPIIIARKQKHYLSLGRSVDRKSIKDIEEMNRNAYRVPDTAAKDLKKRQILRKSFHTYRSRLDAHKLERLYVAEEVQPSDDSDEETDPEFLRIVNGRPPRDQSTLLEHSWAVQSCFLTRLRTGEYEAQLHDMERKKLHEEQLLEKTKIALQKQVDGFNQFLKEDHASSVNWLAKAEAAEAETVRREEKIIKLRKELKGVETRVQLLEDQWRQSKLLETFLQRVAPLTWRRAQNIHMDEDANERSLLDETEDKPELKTRLEIFMNEASSLKPPALYFESAEQLFDIFQALEHKYSNSLLQCEKMKPSVITIESNLSNSNLIFEEERSNFVEDVEDLEKAVAADEEEAKRLEEEAKEMCGNHLYNLLNDAESVKIEACVEDAYMRAIGPNDSGLNPLAMMKAIETKHEALVLGLDILPPEIVAQTRSDWDKEEARIMAEAKAAAKKVHQMNTLIKKFSTSLKPWTARPKRRLVFRSEPPTEILPKEPPPPPLTDSQLEYRQFFDDSKVSDMYRPLI